MGNFKADNQIKFKSDAYDLIDVYRTLLLATTDENKFLFCSRNIYF